MLPSWLLTYLLTQWSRAPLEKLAGSAASQEVPRIFGTRRFLTVPTSARHLSYPEPIPSSPHNFLPLPEVPSQYYPSIYVCVSPVVSFPRFFQSEPGAHLDSRIYGIYYIVESTMLLSTIQRRHIFCVSIAAMVTRNHRIVTSYVHGLPCLILFLSHT